MTMTPDRVGPTPAHPQNLAAANAGSYVDWAAILAGAVFAYALFFVLASFGVGIGLTIVSPEPGEGVSLRWFMIAAGIWFVWIAITSFAAGGYLAGRMRRPVGDADLDEVETRDGGHGLMVWGAGVLLASVISAAGFTNVIGGAASGLASAGDTVAESMEDTIDYFAGVALRTGEGAVAGDAEVRNEIAAVLTRSLERGEVREEDRAYLASLVASNTAATPEDARAQVDAAIAEAEAAWQEVTDAAEQARIASAIGAFIIAATLLAAAAAAYFAATTGGQHRDQNIGFGTFGR